MDNTSLKTSPPVATQKALSLLLLLVGLGLVGTATRLNRDLLALLTDGGGTRAMLAVSALQLTLQPVNMKFASTGLPPKDCCSEILFP